VESISVHSTLRPVIRPIVPAPGDYDDGEIGGMMIGRGNRSTRRKASPVPFCPPQIPHAARNRTPAAAVGSQQLTASATAWSFWDITPCSPRKVNRPFGRTCRYHIQGRRISRARNQRESSGKQKAWYLARLFFDPEDGSNMLLQNAGWLSTDYTALYIRIQNSS
jgi:hypothetical protein